MSLPYAYYGGQDHEVAYQYKVWANLTGWVIPPGLENVPLHQIMGDQCTRTMQEVLNHAHWFRTRRFPRFGHVGEPVLDYEPWVDEKAGTRSSWRWYSGLQSEDSLKRVQCWADILHNIMDEEMGGDDDHYWYNLRAPLNNFRSLTRIQSRQDNPDPEELQDRMERYTSVTDVWVVDPNIDAAQAEILRASDQPVSIWLHASLPSEMEQALNLLKGDVANE